jgi:signal transduction histidine kinase
MKAWWGKLSLRARLASAFGLLAAAALIFLLATVARTLGAESLTQGKILPAAAFVLAAFFIGGWFVAGWCLAVISRLGARINENPPKPLPAELEGLAALLRREAQKRDRLLQELRRFTAYASHELRTPLTALRSVGEVALRGRNDDPIALRDTIGSMLEEVQRMNALVERLLRLARVESEGLAVQARRVQLATHLAALCDSVKVLAEEKNIQIRLECSRALDLTTDLTLLGHAVTNLLVNAIQHSTRDSTVTVKAIDQCDHVEIEISDHGLGIAPEHQTRIFERFYRINDSRSDDRGGFGLGLPIVKSAIERLGGTVNLSSEFGNGATFRIILPALAPNEPV